MSLNEADTCRVYVTPKLRESGWEKLPHVITEQKTFTDGRVLFRGNKSVRGEQKRADYLLRYTRDFSIAVVEAKAEEEPAGRGIQQAKEYAEILGLKFAYATNGHEIEAQLQCLHFWRRPAGNTQVCKQYWRCTDRRERGK